MKIGYARVSTKDQTVALRVGALKKVGCTKVHTEVMNGSRSDRPVLTKLLEKLRAGDVAPYREHCAQKMLNMEIPLSIPSAL